LQFADRDALAFLEWLKSPAGGSVPEVNISILINKDAKNANIVAALDGIIEKVDSNDIVYFYFSGHGDIEAKTRNQLGFLLAYDSAPTNYKASAYSLFYLQDNIETFSAKNAKVIVVMDACHAGKLAGTSIGGWAITAQNLAQQFGNEVKILSCQANELSIESKHWGGGRGVFSYFLIDGLTGLADKNSDHEISLHEIDRFLGEVVPYETDPHIQIPLVIGNRQTILAHVNEPSLAELKIRKSKESTDWMLTDTKGFIENYFELKDSICQFWLKKFNESLLNGNLLTPSGYSANDYYIKLIQVDELKPIHGLLRRNLAAALQNEPQQAINAFLECDPLEFENWNTNPAHYNLYPDYLKRALDLLGEKHYSKNSIRAKQLYFQAYLLKRFEYESTINPWQQNQILFKVRDLLKKAIEIEPESAYLYFAMGDSYRYNNPNQTDSVEWYNMKATEFSPHWLMPYLEISYEYSQCINDLLSAEKWLNKAMQVDSESIVLLERIAWLKQWQGKTEEAIAYCRRIINNKPSWSNGYNT